jgi:hypothetical protein
MPKNTNLPASDDPQHGAPADPLKVRDFWLEVVRPAADSGKLEKIPTVKARTPRQAAIARTQNYWLTRRTIGGFGDNYDRIQWNHTREEPPDGAA